MRIQLPILSFLSLPLLLLPLPWHLRARNIATLTIFTALFITNLTHGVNSVSRTYCQLEALSHVIQDRMGRKRCYQDSCVV